MEKKELLQIVGGFKLTSSFLNAIYRTANAVVEIGRTIGSTLRRIKEGRMCPL